MLSTFCSLWRLMPPTEQGTATEEMDRTLGATREDDCRALPPLAKTPTSFDDGSFRLHDGPSPGWGGGPRSTADNVGDSRMCRMCITCDVLGCTEKNCAQHQLAFCCVALLCAVACLLRVVIRARFLFVPAKPAGCYLGGSAALGLVTGLHLTCGL